MNTTKTYKEFDGNKIEEMPRLIDEGRLPISVRGLMKLRIGNTAEGVKNTRGYYLEGPRWAQENAFTTGDAIAYAAGGEKFKVVLDASQLCAMNPDSKSLNGALVLEDGFYETLQGPEFNRKDLYLNKNMIHGMARESLVWKAVTSDDQLFEEYSGRVFHEIGKRERTHGMGIHLADGEKVPTMQAICLDGIVDMDIYGKSQLRNDLSLYRGYAPLLGVLPQGE